MRNKVWILILLFLLMLIGEVLLANAEFFPSNYGLKLGLMLGCTIVATICLIVWMGIWGRGKGITKKIGWYFLVLVVFAVGGSFALVNSELGGDREFLETRFVEGVQVELYHLDRFDHTAIEIFYAPKGYWTASRYYQDHFTLDKVIEEEGALIVQGMYENLELRLDLKTLEIRPHPFDG